jgi:hypothetical protein
MNTNPKTVVYELEAGIVNREIGPVAAFFIRSDLPESLRRRRQRFPGIYSRCYESTVSGLFQDNRHHHRDHNGDKHQANNLHVGKEPVPHAVRAAEIDAKPYRVSGPTVVVVS